MKNELKERLFIALSPILMRFGLKINSVEVDSSNNLVLRIGEDND